MTSHTVKTRAITRAREIVEREGAALVFSVSDFDPVGIVTGSTLLGAAIAKALIQAYEDGATSRQAGECLVEVAADSVPERMKLSTAV